MVLQLGKTADDNLNQFAIVKISAEAFERIKASGKLHKAKINDIIIAVFMRAFINFRLNNDKVSKPLILPVDLRKYIKSGHNTALCSLTASMIINVGYEIGSSFIESLDKVVRGTSFKKEIYAEMNMFSPFLVLSKLMTYDKLKA